MKTKQPGRWQTDSGLRWVKRIAIACLIVGLSKMGYAGAAVGLIVFVVWLISVTIRLRRAGTRGWYWPLLGTGLCLLAIVVLLFISERRYAHSPLPPPKPPGYISKLQRWTDENLPRQSATPRDD